MKAFHTLVTGSSGGGKTTLCREMHETFPFPSIFLTTKSSESGVAGRRVAGRTAMQSAERDAQSWSDVKMKWYGCEYPQATEAARAYAQGVWDRCGVPTQIIVDECQNSPLSDGEGALKHGLHEDRDVGIKWVPATQHPQDLKESRGYPAINQVRWIVWCGPEKTFHSGFTDYYKISGILPSEDYHFVKILPTRPPTVEYRGETKPRYG